MAEHTPKSGFMHDVPVLQLDVLFPNEAPRYEVVELPVEAVMPSVGTQATLIEVENGPDQRLIIRKQLATEWNLSYREATDLLAEWQIYRESLTEYGWCLTEIIDETIQQHDTGWYLGITEKFVPGWDGERAFRDPRFPVALKTKMVQALISRLYAYPEARLYSGMVAGQTVTLLPHGLDLKPANMTLDSEDGRLWLLDTFAPKSLDPQRRWRSYRLDAESYSPRASAAICATREGVLLRFWRLAEQQWLEGETARRIIEPNASIIELADMRQFLIDQLTMYCEYSPRLTQSELDFLQTEIYGGYSWLQTVIDERW